MPLKLVPPRIGKSPNWTIRGTHLGVGINRSSGSREKKIAQAVLNRIKREIECGQIAGPETATFATAARDYMMAGGEKRFLEPLLLHFGERTLASIDQAAIDAAAAKLYPRATPATRNRQVYSPVSAILRRAGVNIALHRPKGAQGEMRQFFFTPEEASRLFAAAADDDAEFAIFLAFLLYTGARLSEALSLEISDLDLSNASALLRKTKNGSPRLCHLPPALVTALAEHPRRLTRLGKVFRFSKCGALYDRLDEAAKGAGVQIPPGVAFHAFRHSYGSWMRRKGGLDTTGLVATGAWASRAAAARYEHADTTEEARKADLLPDLWKNRGTGSNRS